MRHGRVSAARNLAVHKPLRDRQTDRQRELISLIPRNAIVAVPAGETVVAAVAAGRRHITARSWKR